MSNAYEEYMRQMVIPMRQELVRSGFEELTTEEAVTEFMENTTGTTLVMVNSVCGCAAGIARPAAAQAVVHDEKQPNHLVTVFAGQDKEATAKTREYFEENPPSSPSMALLKEKKIVNIIQRHEIEGATMDEIITNLEQAFEKNC
ncbi:hypothetical protein ADK18_10615 [Bacillus anthracis]|nr:hypothetical protein ADK17_11785 [Bacillus anthracis]KOS28604.1 hypothetical protein ADK18_10615 [Bacillus anthracis]